MTSTAPWRRMILHFSHIGLTDGRTFMIPFGSHLRRCRLWPPQGAAATGRGRALTGARARADYDSKGLPLAQPVPSGRLRERTDWPNQPSVDFSGVRPDSSTLGSAACGSGGAMVGGGALEV